MEAVILAGGFGTRLQSVITDVPKPMADIKGKPFLCYLMDYLSSYTISKIMLSVGYKYENITNYFGSRYKNLDIEYVIEEEPLGTGGAIKKALEQVKGKAVIVMNGDTFFNLDIKKIVDFHFGKDAMLTIAVKPMHNYDRYDSIIFEDNKIMDFADKSFKSFGHINGGVYVLSKKILNYFGGFKKNFSFEIEFLRKTIHEITVYPFISDSYFIDIGIPEDYRKAQKELGLFFKENC